VFYFPSKTFLSQMSRVEPVVATRTSRIRPVELFWAARNEHDPPQLDHRAVGDLLRRAPPGEPTNLNYFVGEPPADSVVYDLSLREPFEWQGPWDAADGEPARLVTYRHLPNAGRAPAPAVSGGRFVEDPQRGPVLELGGPQDAIWLARNRDTVMDPEGHPNKTISLWFKAEDAEERQVLYAQGHHLVGFNIYLHEGRIHAGSWAPVDGQIFDWFPVPGRSFEGHWLSAGGIEPGRWYHVALVLREATTEVLPDKQHLYLDGELVDRGPGVRIPRQYGVARVGLGPIGNNLLMRFHDGESDHRRVAGFRGRLAGFRLTHDSLYPGK